MLSVGVPVGTCSQWYALFLLNVVILYSPIILDGTDSFTLV